MNWKRPHCELRAASQVLLAPCFNSLLQWSSKFMTLFIIIIYYLEISMETSGVSFIYNAYVMTWPLKIRNGLFLLPASIFGKVFHLQNTSIFYSHVFQPVYMYYILLLQNFWRYVKPQKVQNTLWCLHFNTAPKGEIQYPPPHLQLAQNAPEGLIETLYLKFFPGGPHRPREKEKAGSKGRLYYKCRPMVWAQRNHRLFIIYNREV